MILNIGLGIDKWKWMLYLCCMKGIKTGNVEVSEKLKLTRFIEEDRKRRKKTISDLCVVMGISVDTYRRRLGSEDGFTEREIHLAAGELGVDIKAEVRL